jgi:hypothetical protein
MVIGVDLRNQGIAEGTAGLIAWPSPVCNAVYICAVSWRIPLENIFVLFSTEILRMDVFQHVYVRYFLGILAHLGHMDRLPVFYTSETYYQLV